MKIAIVGAGLAGLAAGHWLTKKGCNVEIYEATERPGGRAVTLQTNETNYPVDVGTQYFHSNYSLAKQLISDVGLKQSLRKIKGKTRFFDSRVAGGSFSTGHRVPYIHSGSLMQNLNMLVRGLARLGLHPINPFSVLNQPGSDLILASQKVTDPFEWEYNARALIMAGALVEPDESQISYLHLIRLMRIIVMSDYLCLDGGIASLHQSLSKDLKIHYRSPIKALAMENGKANGVVCHDGKTLKADRVVIATTPKAAASIIPKSWEPEIGFLGSIDQPPAIIATFFLNRRLEDKVWSYIFRQSKSRLVSFCVDATMKNPAMTSGSNSVLQAWICAPSSKHAMAVDDAELQKAIVAELQEHFPAIGDYIIHAHIHRVPHAVPQTPVGHNAAAGKFLASADKRPNVEFCGDYMSGGYMECALWSAKRAVDRISADADS